MTEDVFPGTCAVMASRTVPVVMMRMNKVVYIHPMISVKVNQNNYPFIINPLFIGDIQFAMHKQNNYSKLSVILYYCNICIYSEQNRLNDNSASRI